MEPRRWDGASVERSVLRRLHRLDRALRVTFSPYALDTFTGVPIEMKGFNTDTGEFLRGPLREPAFYLWKKDANSSHHFFVQSYPLGLTGGFGHLEVLKLEADVGRFMSPAHAWRTIQEQTDRVAARRTAQHRQHMFDKVNANRKLAMDIATGKRTTRDGRAFSFAGQTLRRSGGEMIVRPDNRELGIEE